MLIEDLSQRLREAIDPELDKGFTVPTTPKELLERGLVMARDEHKWITGEWLSLDPTTMPDSTADWDYSQVSCGNVKACAMGLLVLATYNGPLIRAYYQCELHRSFESICQCNPLIRTAGPILAYALDGVRGTRYASLEHYLENPDDAMNRVISINDFETGPDLMIRGFERAVEIATDLEKTSS